MTNSERKKNENFNSAKANIEDDFTQTHHNMSIHHPYKPIKSELICSEKK